MAGVRVAAGLMVAVLAAGTGSSVWAARGPAGGPAAPKRSAAPAPRPAPVRVHARSARMSSAALNNVVETYCSDCHNETKKKGNLNLLDFNVDSAPAASHVA